MNGTWEFDRPVDCESCKANGNYANTPKIIINIDPHKGAPLGSVACRWCGIKVTAPTLGESIIKWRDLQEVIRLGYLYLEKSKGEG